MWMRVHILGTASGRPTTHRDVSGTVIQTPEGVVAIDPGEGFQQRVLRQARVLAGNRAEWRPRISRIDGILLTHGHLDHVAGVLPMIHSMGLDGRKRTLEIIGPSTSVSRDDNPFDLASQFEMMQRMGATDPEAAKRLEAGANARAQAMPQERPQRTHTRSRLIP